MTGQATVPITPDDLAHWLLALNTGGYGNARLELEAHAGRSGSVGLLVTVSVAKPTSPNDEGARTSATMAWPCRTHKSVLGLAVYLCRAVEQQIEADQALESVKAAAQA
jgi:hypothetical protein